MKQDLRKVEGMPQELVYKRITQPQTDEIAKESLDDKIKHLSIEESPVDDTPISSIEKVKDEFLTQHIEKSLSSIKISQRFSEAGFIRPNYTLNEMVTDELNRYASWFDYPFSEDEQALVNAIEDLNFVMLHNVRLGGEMAKKIAYQGHLLSGCSDGMAKTSDPKWHKNFVFFYLYPDQSLVNKKDMLSDANFILNAQNNKLFSDGLMSFFDIHRTRSSVGVGEDVYFRMVFDNGKTTIETGHYSGKSQLVYRVNGQDIFELSSADIFYGPTIKLAMAMVMVKIYRHCDTELKDQICNAVRSGDQVEIARFFDNIFGKNIEAKIPKSVELDLDPSTVPKGPVSSQAIFDRKRDNDAYSGHGYD